MASLGMKADHLLSATLEDEAVAPRVASFSSGADNLQNRRLMSC
jgi:hypothetical protein